MLSSRAITALSGAALAGGIGVAVARQSTGPVTSVAALSVAIGWSRLYLDEHWMDDVAGGLMAGVAIGLGAATVSAYTP